MATGDKLVTLDGLKAVYQDVNGNITELQSAKQYYISTVKDFGTLEVGNINSSNGATNNGQTAWRRTPPIWVMKGSTVTTTNYGYGVRIGLYSNSRATTSGDNVERVNITANSTSTYTASQDGWIRIAFGSDGTNIPTAIPQQIVPTLYNGSAISGNPKVLFVATDGNDANDGSYGLPLATVDQALKLGANVVSMKPGTYAQRVDRTLVKSTLLITKASANDKVVFISPGAVVANAATNVSGKVYSASFSGQVVDNQRWLFQDGIPDASTEITSDRHPSQKRRAYRCLDTKIDRCTSTALADALTEIEGADGYKWFYDSANTTMYFSCPSPSTLNANPVCIGNGQFFGSLPDYAQKIDISGIDIKYMSLNMYRTRDSVVSDCSVANVFANSCFDCRTSNGLTFVRCEASRACASATTGDGFSSNVPETATVAADVINYAATLIDCWSHDNTDDGVSFHACGQMTVIGGLYEHNLGGGGVTPSTGCVCDCYNVYARNNGVAGFEYTNPSSDSVPGTILCIGCVSDNDAKGFRVESSGNKGVFVDCKAIGAGVGYSAGTNASIECTDCGVLECTTASEGTVTAKNTTALA